jgi:hypothetical protein
MNRISQLSNFFDKIGKDEKLSPTHVSLFVSLIHHWMHNDFSHPLIIRRKDLMIIGKIKSKATYHKCINELQNFGYIIYKPSFNPYRFTQIHFIDYHRS